jgi:hypothetical protein
MQAPTFKKCVCLNLSINHLNCFFIVVVVVVVVVLTIFYIVARQRFQRTNRNDEVIDFAIAEYAGFVAYLSSQCPF